jgi:uncharacterized membrane protein
MRDHSLIVLSFVHLALMVAIAWVGWSTLPAGTMLPIHWSAAGTADHFAEAATALFVPVAVSAAISLVFAVLPYIEPMQVRMRDSAPLLETAWVGLLVTMTLVEITVAAPAFGLVLPATMPLFGAGALLVVIGNALPKSRPGFFVGIRTPWALLDTDNWIATHRLGSRTMMAAGVVIALAAGLSLDAGVRAILVKAAIAGAVVPPIVYSWWRWRRRVDLP